MPDMALISVKQAAERSGLSERTIRLRASSGEIPGAEQLNGRGAWLIPEEWTCTKAAEKKPVGNKAGSKRDFRPRKGLLAEKKELTTSS